MQKPLPRPNFILCYLCINSGIACSADRELCIGERCCKCIQLSPSIRLLSFFPRLVGWRPQGCDPLGKLTYGTRGLLCLPHMPPLRRGAARWSTPSCALPPQPGQPSRPSAAGHRGGSFPCSPPAASSPFVSLRPGSLFSEKPLSGHIAAGRGCCS